MGRSCSSPRYPFFFQAEDGIRDKLVTGVQTCALPIFVGCIAVFGVAQENGRLAAKFAILLFLFDEFLLNLAADLLDELESFQADMPIGQIGRASCRERV